MTPEEKKQEEELDLLIASFTHDPVKFVKFAYPWGEGELSDSAGPRKWQRESLELIGNHLRNKATRYTPLLLAISSGHGIGKTADIAMVIDWAMSTCEDCLVIVTAQTGTQLRTKTVPEVHKWFGMSINRHWWELKAESISASDVDHQKRWHADFITWNAGNPQAFAGAHNKGKRILIVFDEASDIDQVIWETIEGALTDEQTEIIWLAYGNPTKSTGRFRECFGKFAHRWTHMQIDSREVDGTNKEQIQRWLEDYGEDSDFFRIRVKGEFPRSGSNQFISQELVDAARKYKATVNSELPVILSCDVARFGDDQTVIGRRQGRKFQILAKLRGLDNVQVAFRLIELIVSQQPDAVIVDGDGLGAGVIDVVRHRNYDKNLWDFHGGAAANKPEMYFNRVAELWGEMRDWLSAGAEIPDDPELDMDLTSREYGCARKSDAIQLESKDDMKSRGLQSPDNADCLAMSFHVRVAAKPKDKEKKYVYPAADQITG